MTATLSRTGWGTWSARVYGTGWEATKRLYRLSRWTPARCVWCRRRDRLQINHLTYLFSRNSVRYGPGFIPLPFRLFVLVPMCGRCHGIETWITRNVFRSLTGRRGAHLLATAVPYLLSRLSILAAGAYLIGTVT